MRRPHPLTLVVLAFIIAGLTVFAPPLFSFGEDTERGFPFPYVTVEDYPGSELPIIGPVVKLVEGSTVSFSWQWFLVDVAFYCVAMFFLFSLFSKEEELP